MFVFGIAVGRYQLPMVGSQGIRMSHRIRYTSDCVLVLAVPRQRKVSAFIHFYSQLAWMLFLQNVY